MYLWDDVLRHSQQNIIFSPEFGNYGQLVEAVDKGKQVFNEEFYTALGQYLPGATDTNIAEAED